MTSLWVAVLLASAGCYLLKLAGVALPAAVLAHPRVQRVAELLPVSMLAALVAVELLDAGGRWGADWHVVAGVGVGTLALVVLRLGVLGVFLVAVVTTALLRLLA